MFVTDLFLENFRTYQKQKISFVPTITCFIGANTIGKTNILEALYALATGKSFRAGSDREMIAWEKEIMRIKVLTNEDSLELVLTHGNVGGQKAPLKKYLVNGVARRSLDFVGKCKAVLFAPEDLDLVTGSPSLRRKFLDAVLVQVDREYRRNLLSYEKGIRHRNRVLFQIHEGLATRSQLFFWDQLVIKAGSYITDARANFLMAMNASQLPDCRYELEYDKSIISESRIEQYKDAEVAAKVTLVGPHRDDIVLRHTEKHGHLVETAAYGSRGEQRLGVLWMKLAELNFITQLSKDRPVLLLDDIFSEFDEQHTRLVTNVVSQYQTIITSADEQSMQKVMKNISDVALVHLPFLPGQ